jgi:hypothetical protein
MRSTVAITFAGLFISGQALADQIAALYTDSADETEIRLYDTSLESRGCPEMKGERLASLWYRSPRDGMMAPWGEGCWVPLPDSWIKIQVRQYDGDGVNVPITQ